MLGFFRSQNDYQRPTSVNASTYEHTVLEDEKKQTNSDDNTEEKDHRRERQTNIECAERERERHTNTRRKFDLSVGDRGNNTEDMIRSSHWWWRKSSHRRFILIIETIFEHLDTRERRGLSSTTLSKDWLCRSRWEVLSFEFRVTWSGCPFHVRVS